MIAPPKYSGKSGTKKSSAPGQFKKAAGVVGVALLAIIAVLFVVRRDKGTTTDSADRTKTRKVIKAKE